jgi:hypothetical protein
MAKKPVTLETTTTSEGGVTEVIREVVTHDESFIHQILNENAGQTPDEWKLPAGSVDFYEKHKSMFKLPDELEDGNPKQISDAKNFKYLWVQIDDQKMVRTVMADKWIPVNKATLGWLPKKLCDGQGVIKRSGHNPFILFFQPKDFNLAVRRAQKKQFQQKADDLVDGLKDKGMEIVHGEGKYSLTPDTPPIRKNWDGSSIKPGEPEKFDFGEDIGGVGDTE